MSEVHLNPARSERAVIGEHVVVKTSHSAPVNAVISASLSNGKTLIVSGAGDGMIRRFDAATGESLGESPAGAQRRVLCLTALTLSDGRCLIAAGSDDGIVRRIDASTGQRVGSGITEHSGAVWALTGVQLEDGTAALASAGNDRLIRIFHPITGRSLREPLVGHTDWVRALTRAQLPTGEQLLISAGDDRTVRVFDVGSGEQVIAPILGHSDWVRCVAWVYLSDGTPLVISGGGDGTIRRHHALTGDEFDVPIITSHRRVLSLCVLPLDDGRQVILAGGGDGQVRCFDAQTGATLGDELPRHKDAVLSLTVIRQHDSLLLASAGADRALTLSVASADYLLSSHRPGTSLSHPSIPAARHSGENAASSQRHAAESAIHHPTAELSAPGANSVTGETPQLDIAAEQLDAKCEKTPSPQRRVVADSTHHDSLGRYVLAEHGAQTLRQISEQSTANLAVLHIDGLPGSGKSTLAQQTASMLTRAGAPTVRLSVDLSDHRDPSTAVQALADVLHHGIRAGRGWVSRWGFAQRPRPLHRLAQTRTKAGRDPVVLVIDNLDRTDSTVVAAVLLALGGPLRGAVPEQTAPLWVIVAAEGARLRSCLSRHYAALAELPASTSVRLEKGLSESHEVTRGSGASEFSEHQVQSSIDHTVLVPSMTRSEVVGYLYRMSESRRSTSSTHADSWSRAGFTGTGHTAGADGHSIDPADAELMDLADMAGLLGQLTITPRMLKRIHNCLTMLAVLQEYLGHHEEPIALLRAAVILTRFPEAADDALRTASLPDLNQNSALLHTPAWQDPELHEVLRWPTGQWCELLGLARCLGRQDL